jgi:hypothetical protein
MTNDQLMLAAHQIGMVRAAKQTTDPQIRDQYVAHSIEVAALRTKVGHVYEVYPNPNRELVKALYTSLREGLISRVEFASCLQNMMGEYRWHT